MYKFDENNGGAVSKATRRARGVGMGKRKFRERISHNSRRALTIINQNLPAVNKRGPPLYNGICKQNQAHPIIRKFVDAQSCPEGTSKATDEDFTYVDEEDLASKDHPVPMFLEQTQEQVESEVNHHMEIEMEDTFDDSILDIDSVDTKNSLAVVDYVEDIYAYYRKMEGCGCVSPYYMEQQSDINERMRGILIDWLVEVQHKYELREETLFLTVNLIDRFLAQQTVSRKNLQLVGLSAMFLACKYEDVSIPAVGDLIYISNKSYTRKEVLEMEMLMVNKLQFNLSLPTPYVFIIRFLKAAQSEKKLEHLAFFLMELCLVEYEMLKFPPSLLAAATVYTAHCALYGFSQWNQTCEFHSTYSEDNLLECSRLIVGYHERARTGKLTAVYRKYNTSKFGFAATCEPPQFLLQNTTTKKIL